MNPLNWSLPWGVVVAILFCIVFARATGTYYIGRAVVAGTAKSRWSAMIDSKPYKLGAAWLNRWGAPAVTLCFITVGVQTAVLLAAGISRMPPRKFFLALIPGSLIWGMIYGTVGFVGFLSLVELWKINPVVSIITAILAITGIVWGIRSKHNKKKLEAEALVSDAVPATETA